MQFLLDFYKKDTMKYGRLFEMKNWQLVAPGSIKYPPPRFPNGLINEGMIIKELNEIVISLGLTGGDLKIIKRRDALNHLKMKRTLKIHQIISHYLILIY